MVHFRHDLHQALCADRAFRERVQARFDGHHGQDQQRVQLDFTGRQVSRRDEHIGRVVGHAVALGEPVGDPLLLLLRAQQGFFFLAQRCVAGGGRLHGSGRFHQCRQGWRFNGLRFCHRQREQAVRQLLAQVRAEHQQGDQCQGGNAEDCQCVLCRG
ncbi:hypothetical protein D3C72_1159710 [compost metagenome]